MALTPRLDLRQTQALVMTPQLQQAIKLLQLSNVELATYVEQQVEQNPLLEREESDRFEPLPADRDEPESPAPDDGRVEMLDRTVADDAENPGMDGLDVDYDNVFDQDAPGGLGGDPAMPVEPAGGVWNVGSGEGGEGGYETTLSGVTTLREHLAQQIACDVADPVDRMIGAQLVELLDDSGYLVGDTAEIARALACAPERIEAVLPRLQRLDPPGVFARNLRECLALQLRERDRLDPAMEKLLDNLDKVARRDIAALVRLCGVDAEDVADMVAEIRALNPKPALAFDSAVAHPVTPDVIMRPSGRRGWIVELNTETLPRVLVNNQYYAQISRMVRSKEDKQYVSECLQSANWLVKALHQRATTILKVATEIVRQQDGFFVNGVQSLKPLVLRDIAQAIEMHESTVSRVTSNKYMSTPRGIFELKYFFTQAIGGFDGADPHSAEFVRHRIRAVIDDETAGSVLSDDAIVDMLQNEGVDIARRTVAKYRESMGIPSSVQRRREKAAGL